MGKEKERKRKEDKEHEHDEKRRDRSKKKKRASPELQDEAKRKKHRTVASGDESKREKRDESKNRRDKSHKSHSRSKEKSGGKHGNKSQKRSKYQKSEMQEISSSDYFSKNNEFATWLKEEKNMFFSDLSSEAARDLFSEFVAEWNDCKLESQYYEGITTGPRTSHKWNIRV